MPIRNVNTYRDCQYNCSQNNDCRFWNYNSENKECWLKGGKGVSDVSQRILGLKNAPRDQWLINTDIPGYDISMDESEDACQQACRNHGNCDLWVYDSKLKKCFLKDAPRRDKFITGLKPTKKMIPVFENLGIQYPIEPHETGQYNCGPNNQNQVCGPNRYCSQWGWCGGDKNGSQELYSNKTPNNYKFV
jgi:hypothetical protein